MLRGNSLSRVLHTSPFVIVPRVRVFVVPRRSSFVSVCIEPWTQSGICKTSDVVQASTSLDSGHQSERVVISNSAYGRASIHLDNIAPSGRKTVTMNREKRVGGL